MFDQGKLDSYRDILKRGKALNEDQQSAVDRLKMVVDTVNRQTICALLAYL